MPSAIDEPLAESERQMFDKPNLQLRDPDPYAFANRIWRLTLVFAVLCAVAAGPYLAGQFWYTARYNTLKAEHDAAGEILGDLRPRLQDFALASRMVAKKVGPSVVNIYRPHFRGTDGQGSGVIMDEAGFILTNFHVVEDAKGLRVQLDDGRDLDAAVIGYDRATDLAVLKVNAENLIAASWGDSDLMELGDMVWAMGSPFGLSRSITFGIVSAKHRSSQNGIRTASVYQEYLQTDVAVNPGNSGGPLVDLEGRVVGINTAILGETYQGVSFAIPSAIAREKYEQLRDKGYIERGYLGVQPSAVPERVRRKLELEQGQGVLIADVVADGPAGLAGIQRFDVILRWNNHEATNPTMLSRTIANTQIGSTATVLVKRVEQGQVVEKSMDVEVGLKPYADEAPTKLD
ncbi:S1C family serine protease [Posidoniimonas polymericola]|uniref:S1C family serine protease n=1 Tax=Posidoniimonas polymericola TaxID=2528002 RepID=UPI0011B7E367|nr:trypsin-like peptidase domain-containing protein [Posidoniimonas polymericola]